jgi:glycosyltransferase involved in cell wall biosynthesis
LVDNWRVSKRAAIFHGLNQRLPEGKLRRTVTTFHDLFVLTGEYSTPEFRARFKAQAMDAAWRSDLIIAISEFTASQVRDLLKVEPSRIRVVHHGVAMPDDPGSDAEHENVILHVGAIQTRKNLTRLIDAFGRVPSDWRLVLAGAAGYGGHEIIAAIPDSVRPRIEITGYASDADLRSWYRRASILAFPSLDEGFGLPVLEAMAHGVPVLTSDRSALPEVAGDAAVLINPHDTDSIANGLQRLVEDAQFRKELGLRGQQRAARFSWRAAVEGTWKVYQELC